MNSVNSTQELGKGIYLDSEAEVNPQWYLFTEGCPVGEGFASPTDLELVATYIFAPGLPERQFILGRRPEIAAAIQEAQDAITASIQEVWDTIA